VGAAEELLMRFCEDLRELRSQAGGPTLRTLADRIGLGKSQIGAILGGRIHHPPDWQVVRLLVDNCYRYAREHNRVDRVSRGSGVDEYWRHRYALLEHVFSQPTRSPRVDRPASGALQVVPRQLPPRVKHLAGRRAALTALSGADGAVVISGPAGVGKTALAVSWSHDIADRYPDGQLYVNLRGFDRSGTATTPGEAIRGFLDAFGVPHGRIPPGVDAQVGLYRSVLAGRRVLVVLDNARDADQVRPLLPGAPECLAVVTSRSQLAGILTTEGARPIRLDLLSVGEATELLASRIGADRVAGEPDAINDIIAACARLPLALCVVASRAALHPTLSLAVLAAEIDQSDEGLDAFPTGDPDTDIRAVFSWSYHTLSTRAARLFRILGFHLGEDIAVPAAASLAGVPAAQAHRDLIELSDAGLITELTGGRYALHDLLRAYAAELAHHLDPATEHERAVRRLFDHYLHSAHAAARLMHPPFSQIRLAPPPRDVTVQRLAVRAAAQDWLAAEHVALLAAVPHAAAAGLDAHAWQIAWTIAGYLAPQGRWRDWHRIQLVALAAAQRLDDQYAQAHTFRNLAVVCSRLGHHDDARKYITEAVNLFDAVGDPNGLAHTHLNFGQILERSGSHREALHHSQRALDLFTTTSNLAGRAYTLNAVGWQHALLGEYEQAVRHCEQALPALRTVGDHQGQADTWDSLGYAHHQLGDHRRAIACYSEALDLFAEAGNRYAEAHTYLHIGDSHHATADHAAAQAAWLRALLLLRELAHPDARQAQDRLDTAGTPASTDAPACHPEDAR
jgi:tetratricopeptide (TPR) repeat protein